MSLLEKLRSKQPYEKNRIAVTGAVALTAIVGLLWLSALPARFDDGNATQSNSGSGSGGQLEDAKEQLGFGLQQMGSIFNAQDDGEEGVAEGDAAEESREGTGQVDLSDLIEEMKEESKNVEDDEEVDDGMAPKSDEPEVILIGTTSTPPPETVDEEGEQNGDQNPPL